MDKCKNRFDGINGLRAFAAIAIIIMHIEANTNYNINSFIYTKIIPSFGLFTFLFMVISAFCLCCGYYEKLKNNKITLNDFYKRRYSRIVPFFAIIVLLEVLYQHSIESIYEGFIDLTLSFSFLPNPEISVIGVGWTLGVIFGFYMLFPFFVFLFDNKKRGIIVTIISILITISCINYFFTNQFVMDNFTHKHNFLYCFMFFASGGLIYLYKDRLTNINKHFRLPLLFACILATVLFLLYVPMNEYRIVALFPLFSLYLIYTVCFDSKLMNNKVAAFVSKYSMEIYLCHMVMFRIVEKLGLLYLFGDGVLSYVFASLLVILGSFIVAIVFNYIYNKLLRSKQK